MLKTPNFFSQTLVSNLFLERTGSFGNNNVEKSLRVFSISLYEVNDSGLSRMRENF